jgi:hypothetical protein
MTNGGWKKGRKGRKDFPVEQTMRYIMPNYFLL